MRMYGTHGIEIVEENSMLFKILREKRLSVNSFHHQSVKDPAADCRICAIAPDGVIEAIEAKDPDLFCLGVQWHPEEMIKDPKFLRIFQSLTEAAK